MQLSEEQKHSLTSTKQTSQLAATSNLNTHLLINPEMQENSSTAAREHHTKPPTTSASSETEIPPPSQSHESPEEGSSDRIDSWSSLSFFGRQDKALEATILQAIGMEKLTRLGRVTSARVTVEHLQLDASAAKNIQRRKKISGTLQPVVPSSRYIAICQHSLVCKAHSMMAVGQVVVALQESCCQREVYIVL